MPQGGALVPPQTVRHQRQIPASGILIRRRFLLGTPAFGLAMGTDQPVFIAGMGRKQDPRPWDPECPGTMPAPEGMGRSAFRQYHNNSSSDHGDQRRKSIFHRFIASVGFRFFSVLYRNYIIAPQRNQGTPNGDLSGGCRKIAKSRVFLFPFRPIYIIMKKTEHTEELPCAVIG